MARILNDHVQQPLFCHDVLGLIASFTLSSQWDLSRFTQVSSSWLEAAVDMETLATTKVVGSSPNRKNTRKEQEENDKENPPTYFWDTVFFNPTASEEEEVERYHALLAIDSPWLQYVMQRRLEISPQQPITIPYVLNVNTTGGTSTSAASSRGCGFSKGVYCSASTIGSLAKNLTIVLQIPMPHSCPGVEVHETHKEEKDEELPTSKKRQEPAHSLGAMNPTLSPNRQKILDLAGALNELIADLSAFTQHRYSSSGSDCSGVQTLRIVSATNHDVYQLLSEPHVWDTVPDFETNIEDEWERRGEKGGRRTGAVREAVKNAFMKWAPTLTTFELSLHGRWLFSPVGWLAQHGIQHLHNLEELVGVPLTPDTVSSLNDLQYLHSWKTSELQVPFMGFGSTQRTPFPLHYCVGEQNEDDEEVSTTKREEEEEQEQHAPFLVKPLGLLARLTHLPAVSADWLQHCVRQVPEHCKISSDDCSDDSPQPPSQPPRTDVALPNIKTLGLIHHVGSMLIGFSLKTHFSHVTSLTLEEYIIDSNFVRTLPPTVVTLTLRLMNIADFWFFDMVLRQLPCLEKLHLPGCQASEKTFLKVPGEFEEKVAAQFPSSLANCPSPAKLRSLVAPELDVVRPFELFDPDSVFFTSSPSSTSAVPGVLLLAHLAEINISYEGYRFNAHMSCERLATFRQCQAASSGLSGGGLTIFDVSGLEKFPLDAVYGGCCPGIDDVVDGGEQLRALKSPLRLNILGDESHFAVLTALAANPSLPSQSVSSIMTTSTRRALCSQLTSLVLHNIVLTTAEGSSPPRATATPAESPPLVSMEMISDAVGALQSLKTLQVHIHDFVESPSNGSGDAVGAAAEPNRPLIVSEPSTAGRKMHHLKQLVVTGNLPPGGNVVTNTALVPLLEKLFASCVGVGNKKSRSSQSVESFITNFATTNDLAGFIAKRFVALTTLKLFSSDPSSMGGVAVQRLFLGAAAGSDDDIGVVDGGGKGDAQSNDIKKLGGVDSPLQHLEVLMFRQPNENGVGALVEVLHRASSPPGPVSRQQRKRITQQSSTNHSHTTAGLVLPKLGQLFIQCDASADAASKLHDALSMSRQKKNEMGLVFDATVLQ